MFGFYSKKQIVPFVAMLFVVFLLFFAVFIIYVPRSPFSSESKTVIFKTGEGAKELSIKLENEGVIRNGSAFRVYAQFAGISEKLIAGQYSLSPSMTIPEIAQKIADGDSVKEKVTLIEGWNLRDIHSYLIGQGIFGAGNLYKVTGTPLTGSGAKDFSGEFNFLKDKPDDVSLEGYIFPDTYFFDPPDEVGQLHYIEDIVRMTLENFDAKLTSDLREKIKAQNKTIFETVTMASLIEEEVKTMGDKKIVSGILWKRLESGMPLQVDSTVRYSTGKESTKVSIDDTKVDSPYNTYKHRGLPKGPICNPGIESIRAAIEPADSVYWYYLSAPDGTIIYSRTLQEHIAAQAKYLK